jgi:L,D-peptidoglycan transpeptidase YkuD (ErfK/YbiS/YcfS/YnhG family)
MRISSILSIIVFSAAQIVVASAGLENLDLSAAKDSEQVLVVYPKSGVAAELELFEKIDGQWKSKSKFPAVIGLKGFAKPGEKKEGDRKTPSGIFELGDVFGYSATAATRMPYRQSTEDDKFIDDVQSDAYNTWVKGPTAAKSFEKMKRKDGLYEYGVVVNYNMNPVIKGNGSAIFIHVWRSPTSGTAGCVALAKEHVISILKWLDPKLKPKLVLNPGGSKS